MARRMPLQAPDKIERLDANAKEWPTRPRAETRGTRATCLASMMSRKFALDRLRVGTPAGWEGAHYKFSSNQKYIFDHRGGERLSAHAASFSIAYGQNVTSMRRVREPTTARRRYIRKHIQAQTRHSEQGIAESHYTHSSKPF